MKLPCLVLGGLFLLAIGGCQSLREQMLAAKLSASFRRWFRSRLQQRSLGGGPAR